MARDLDTFKAAISGAEPGLTRLESRISTYLLARPEAILVETSAEVARKLNISPTTVTRFYRQLGSPHWTRPLPCARPRAGRGRGLVAAEGWSRIVELVADADNVHAIGLQTMHFLADGLCRSLACLRDRVHLLGGIDGVYTGLLPAAGERITLIIIDTFR